MDEETEFTKLPIEERCQHKLWKARVNGYEEATKFFQQQTDEKHPDFNKYLGLVKKFVVDSNAAAQEKGLVATLAYVENAAVAGRTCGEVMNGIVTKCLGAPRTRTKELAVEVALMYIEIEKHETVQDELMKGLDNKTPKVVAACVFVLREALRLFGIKVISLKPVMKLLPKTLEDRDKTVREEAKLLTVEVYRWIKDAIKPLLQSLKPVQVSELETEFAKVSDGHPSPSRYLRSQQQKVLAAETADGDEEVDMGESTGPSDAVDPYEFLEAVNLLNKMPKNFFEQVEAKKWQDRKDALEALLPLALSPKLEPGEYGDLVRALKRLVAKDSNILVVVLAVRCLGRIATGLRKKFHPYSGQCIPVILEKFKEKKQNVVSALKEAIDAIYLSTTLDAVLEDVQSALDNKNPQIRAETAAFLARAFTKATPSVLNKKLLKPLTASLTKTLNDTDPIVRDNSSEALGTAMKVVGEKSIMPFLQEVEKHKMDKIKEMCDKAVVVSAPVAKSKPSKAPARTVKPSQTYDDDDPGDSQYPSSLPTRRIPVGSAKNVKSQPSTKGIARAATAGATTKKGAKAEPVAEMAFFEKELTDEELQTQMEEILSSDVINGLGSSVWKDRLTSMEKFNEIVQDMDKTSLPSQLLVRILARKPGFKENNIQILKLKFDVLATVLENGPISQTTVGICLSDLVDKIGDAKSGPSAMSAISLMAEATTFDFIVTEVLQLAFSQKNPKNQAESLNWLGNAIKEFGMKMQVKSVSEYLKKGLAHTNPSVRTATISLLGVMYMYMGRPLRTVFEDEKPALLQQIDSELARVQDMKPPQPTRGLKKVGSAAREQRDTEPESGTRNANNFARVDAGSMIHQSVYAEMEDKNWNVRADALQKVANALSDSKLSDTDVSDIAAALKSRLTDSNKKIALQAITICQSLGVSLGPNCSRHIRTVAPELLASMGDLKNNVRTAAITCLNTWLENCSVNCIFEGDMISDALKTENPTLRQELFGWLAEKLQSAKSVPAGDLTQCLPYLYCCLEDRSPEVRKKALDAVLPFMIHLGFEPMSRAATKLKPVSKTIVLSHLDKARPNLPVKATPQVSAKTRAAAQPSPTNTEKGTEESAQGFRRIPRSGSKSKIAVKSSTPSSAVSSTRSFKKEDDDPSPALPLNNQKDQRMIDDKSIKTLRWNFTTPREEYYTLLRELMTNANWNTVLVSNCFSNDFKQHLKALDSLIAFLSVNLQATIANLDLILKWLALRFFDTNPSVLIKGLEYLQQLFPLLASCDYRMSEMESSSFIPYLILKIGDPKDPVRKGVHDILHQMFHVYPATKIFTHLMQGLSSKNARQRAECLDELGFMIESFGMTVCQPSPASALKDIAKMISDRDNGVRTAALNCVVQAYFIDGEKVYKYVGQLSDKDMGLLEERIKRSTKTRNQAPAPEVVVPPAIPSYHASPPGSNLKSAGVVQQALKQEIIDPSATIRIHKSRPASRPVSMGGIQLDTEKIEKEYKVETPTKTFPPTVNINDDANELLNMPDVKLPKTRLRPTASAVKLLNSSENAEMALNLVLAQLAATSIPIVVEAFAQVEEVLHQEDKAETAMASRVDQLLLMGALQYRMAYSKHMTDENICKADVIKLYRCVTMTLTTLFGHKTLPKKASRDVLRDLIPHLVTVILDSRLNELLEGPQVVRSLNMLVIRIIQKGNPTQVMSALIKLLCDCVGNMSSSERHTELIMKCLWKMLRLMDSYITELNVDYILLDAHQFLKMYPSSFWKEKKESDTPLRTVKTLLFHLVQHKGEDILKHLVLIPNRQESDLVLYLNKMLHLDRTGSPRLNHQGSLENFGSNKKSRHSPMRLSKTNHEFLAEIFKKIGDKEHTKEGLLELYEFQKLHPHDNIEPFLQKSSEFFQNYIRRGLKSIDQDRTHKSHTTTVYSSPTTNLNANVQGSGYQDNFCNIPPVDASPLDYIEYLKALAARLQVDGSKYSDPAFLQHLMESARASKENKDGYKRDVEASIRAYEEIKSMFEADTGCKFTR